MTAEQIRHAHDLLTRPDNTVSAIARLLGISRSTLYKHLPELGAGPPTASPVVGDAVSAGVPDAGKGCLVISRRDPT